MVSYDVLREAERVVGEKGHVVLCAAQDERTTSSAEGARDLQRVVNSGEGGAGAGPGLHVGPAALKVVGVVAGYGEDGRVRIGRGAWGRTRRRDRGMSRRSGACAKKSLLTVVTRPLSRGRRGWVASPT